MSSLIILIKKICLLKMVEFDNILSIVHNGVGPCSSFFSFVYCVILREHKCELEFSINNCVQISSKHYSAMDIGDIIVIYNFCENFRPIIIQKNS